MYEVITDWTCNSHTGLKTVMYFELGAGIAAVRTSLNTFYVGLVGSLAPQTSYAIQPTGRTMDPSTGTMTGIWTESTLKTGVGTATAQSWPDAAQALIRWRTGDIVDGRFVEGRTFIPGLAQNVMANGNLTAALVSDWTAKAQAFADAANGFSIWHRPHPSPPPATGNMGDGSLHNVVTGSVWPEVAVLRRRRL